MQPDFPRPDDVRAAARQPHAGGSPGRRAISSARPGFSLIELIVVLLILSILVALAIQKYSAGPSPTDRLAADTLMTHLRYCHNLAMDRERAIRVIFNLASNNYAVAVFDTNAPDNFAAVQDPVRQTDWVFNIADQFAGAALADVNINGGATLYFSSTNGIPCDGAGTPLTASGTVAFTSGAIVSITPDTGYIGRSP